MPSNFTQQIATISSAGLRTLNGGAGDEIAGGRINTLPSGVDFNQGNTQIPGSRMVVGEEDALVFSTVSVGTIYGGLYTYVKTKSNSTATPTLGRAVFWDVVAPAKNFQVTPDETGAQGVGLFAGVNLNTLTKGYSWWIQNAGRAIVKFRAVLSGIPADGCSVYLAEAGAGADVGSFDVLDGGGNPTFSQVAQMQRNYVGIAQGLPVADGVLTTVNIPLGRIFRW